MSQSDRNGRLVRALKLHGFNFTIRHRKGSQNIVADSLPRMYAKDNSAIDDRNVDDFWINEMDSSVDIDLQSGEFRYPGYLALIEKLQSKMKHLPDIRIVGAHGGVAKTLRRLKTFYCWPKMNKQISAYVLSCDVCKQTKYSNKVFVNQFVF